MTVPLSDLACRLLDANVFATLSTLNPDGAPQSSIIWVKRDGDDVIFSTIRGRRKTRNMERDPRVSVCMYDPGNPYLYSEIRGEVTISEEDGGDLINELSLRYNGTPFRLEPPEVVRVVCRLKAAKVIDH